MHIPYGYEKTMGIYIRSIGFHKVEKIFNSLSNHESWYSNHEIVVSSMVLKIWNQPIPNQDCLKAIYTDTTYYQI